MCMCKWVKSGDTRVDPCMREEVNGINKQLGGAVVACCCGHGRYRKTIVVKTAFGNMELITSEVIPRIKRFYKRDKYGYYFIPEVDRERTTIPPTDKKFLIMEGMG